MPYPNENGNAGGSVSQKVTESVHEAFTKTKDKAAQAGAAVRDADPKEMLRDAGDYAQKGSKAAYDTVSIPPLRGGGARRSGCVFPLQAPARLAG